MKVEDPISTCLDIRKGKIKITQTTHMKLWLI